MFSSSCSISTSQIALASPCLASPRFISPHHKPLRLVPLVPLVPLLFSYSQLPNLILSLNRLESSSLKIVSSEPPHLVSPHLVPWNRLRLAPPRLTSPDSPPPNSPSPHHISFSHPHSKTLESSPPNPLLHVTRRLLSPSLLLSSLFSSQCTSPRLAPPGPVSPHPAYPHLPVLIPTPLILIPNHLALPHPEHPRLILVSSSFHPEYLYPSSLLHTKPSHPHTKPPLPRLASAPLRSAFASRPQQPTQHPGAMRCNKCAYKKGICAICTTMIMDTSRECRARSAFCVLRLRTGLGFGFGAGSSSTSASTLACCSSTGRSKGGLGNRKTYFDRPSL